MKHTRILSLFTLLCAAIASLQIVHAATITVSNTNDSGASSLRQALADANDGATLTVNSCIVSGNSAEGGGGILSYGVGYGSASLTVNNSTLSGNSAAAGGGILNIWMAVTVTDSTLSDNSALAVGGGIYNN